MKYILDGNEYDVIVEKKNNKNIYIRLKEDGIHVTCSYFVSKGIIKNILDDNVEYLRKMQHRLQEEKNKKNKFFYLGKSYDIIIDENIKNVFMDDKNIHIKSNKVLDSWLKEETLRVFDERYVYIYNRFCEITKSPILKVRNMKSRWGVYNRANHTITLNSRLIEFDIPTIDYVIIHELSHIIHFNHSKSFWQLVSKYCPNYKQIRKEMRK